MKIRITVILALLILFSAGLVLGEDQTEPNASLATPAPAAFPENSDSVNTQWVWGEVVSIDASNKTLLLKYLDYETDQEKEISIIIDDSTSYDNIRTLGEIRPKDNLSIDYIPKDGKNIAKTIGLEKAESDTMQNNIDTGLAIPEANQATPITTPQAPTAATSASAEKPETATPANQ